MRRRFVSCVIPLLFLVSTLATGCESLRLRREAGPEFALSAAERIRLTVESAPAFENAAGGLCPDNELQQYLQKVAASVVAAIPGHHPREFPFTCKALNAKTVNAFALPGGYVYLTRGLLERLRSEDELAAIIADQIAHVTMNHFERRFGELLLVNTGIGENVAAEMISEKCQSPVCLPDSTAVAMNLPGLEFTPEAEMEAARTALHYAALTGRYNPHAVAGVLAMLDSLRGARGPALPAWPQTHPAPPERGREMAKLIEQCYPEFLGREKAYIELGPALSKMRRADETYLSLFEKAEAHMALGARMIGRGFPKSGRAEMESAVNDYDRAIAAARESGVDAAPFRAGRALAYRGLFCATGDVFFRAKARADFDDVRRLDPRNFIARLFRGYYYLRVDGFYGRAEEELLEAARLNPGGEFRGLPYLYLAELYDAPGYERRDDKKAARNYEMYLALDPLGEDAARVKQRLKELKPRSEILELLD